MQVEQAVQGPDCADVNRDEAGSGPEEAAQEDTQEYRVVELA
jgi:hypothetical protein